MILTRFREGAEKAAAWLARARYTALFLDLPRDLETFLKAHIDGEASIEDFWRSYDYLTGFQTPFINAMKYTIDPILDAIVHRHQRIPKPEIYCYQDIEHHFNAQQLSERLLLLETKSRMSRKIEVKEWRRLLRDEQEEVDVGFRASMENIEEETIAHSRSVVLYTGMVQLFKRYMNSKGLTVEVVYLQHYWRSPLDALRVIAWAKGVENISDDVFAWCVQCHLKYLDHVLSSQDLDTAHAKWILEIQRSRS